MTRPFVVDANAFKQMFEDLTNEREGLGKKVFDAIFISDYVILDEGGKIKNEWQSCSCGLQDELFSSWVADRMIADKIRMVSVKQHKQLKAEMKKFGMPKKDEVYLFTAANNQAYAVISEDIDLYDPKAKGWTLKARRKLMESGSACVAKYMRKEHSVLVFPLCIASDHCS